jgi:hypothetical protein
MKKNIIIALAGITVVLACDSSTDLFEKINDPISFEIRTDDGLYNYDLHNKYADSVKINQPRTVYLTLRDDMKELSAVFSFDKGENNITLTLDDDTIVPSQRYSVVVGQRLQLSIIGKSSGEVVGQLKFTDYYGETLSIPLSLFVFDNLYPTCKIEVKEVKELSEYEYLIDLSKSFDRDARFGGNIVMHEYKIGNYYSLTTEREAIYHIFPTVGTYDVKCRVKDNDGAWSDIVTTKVIIE